MTYLKESRNKPGVLPDDPMSEAGRKVLAHHFARMLKEEPAVRKGGNADAVHDMRVATRRMRSAFDLFEPFYCPDSIRPLRRKLRRVARALGRVRDLDVFHQKLDDYLKTQPDAAPGMARAIDALQARQDAARAELLALLNSDFYRRFLEQMTHFAQTTGYGANLRSDPEDAEQPPPNRVCEVAPRLIYAQYGVVRAYERLLPGASLDALHALRIEAKRLRYMLEAFSEVLGPEAKVAIEAAKNLQDYLGELQDARVALEMLADLSESAPDPAARQAMQQYMDDRRAEKKRLRAGVPDAWAAYIAPDVRRAVALAVAAL